MNDTYRIRPLAWDKGESTQSACVAPIGTNAYLHKSGPYWFWSLYGFRGQLAFGQCRTEDAARLAAESAYQELVKSALEPA